MYRIQIDPSLCSGFGSCAELAPHSITIGAEGLAQATVTVTDDSAVLEAAAACPMGAIEVIDEHESRAA